jgi:hypothetical protein
MSHRLQILISPELNAQLEKAAQRSCVSKAEWVRRVLRGATTSDPLARMDSLNGPVADIAQMLAEIEAGRS